MWCTCQGSEETSHSNCTQLGFTCKRFQPSNPTITARVSQPRVRRSEDLITSFLCCTQHKPYHITQIVMCSTVYTELDLVYHQQILQSSFSVNSLNIFLNFFQLMLLEAPFNAAICLLGICIQAENVCTTHAHRTLNVGSEKCRIFHMNKLKNDLVGSKVERPPTCWILAGIVEY